MGCRPSCLRGADEPVTIGAPVPPLNRQRSVSSSIVLERSSNHNVDLHDVYDFNGPLLGSGMSGTVRVVVHRRSGKKYALKSILLANTPPSIAEQLRKEIDVLKQLDHPNIIRLFEVYETDLALHLVMELCTGGELFEQLKTGGGFSEERAARLIQKMLQAVAYCHACGVAHRDIKLANFVFENRDEDAELKLIDFGLSRLVADSSGEPMNSFVGSVYYTAPEVLRQIPYSTSCDVWGLGVITYMMLCGRPPFTGGTVDVIRRSVLSGKVKLRTKEWSGISSSAKDFVTALLTKDPKKRPTAEAALRHPWLLAHSNSTATNVAIGPEILDELCRFESFSRLKKTVFVLLARLSDQQTVQELRKIFWSIDTDQSGNISREELRSAMLSSSVPDWRINRCFEAMDWNQSGTITYSEFMAAALASTKKINAEQLRLAFDRLDVDGSGTITIENLTELLGEVMTKEELEELIAEVDVKKTGEIDYEEFLLTMEEQGVIPQNPSQLVGTPLARKKFVEALPAVQEVEEPPPTFPEFEEPLETVDTSELLVAEKPRSQTPPVSEPPPVADDRQTRRRARAATADELVLQDTRAFIALQEKLHREAQVYPELEE